MGKNSDQSALEEKVNSKRVPVPIILVDFNEVVALGAMPSDFHLAKIIQQRLGYDPRVVREMRQGKIKTGPRELLDFLREFKESEELGALKERYYRERSAADSINGMARNAIDACGFRNGVALTDFLFQELKPVYPAVRHGTLRNLLFSRKVRRVQPWHFAVYGLLAEIVEGSINADRKYLKFDFNTYQRLLRYTFASLNERDSLSLRQFQDLMCGILGIGAETLMYHMYYGKPVKGWSVEYWQRTDGLVQYIKEHVFITIDLTNSAKIEEELQRFKKALAVQEPKKDKVLIIADLQKGDKAMRRLALYAIGEAQKLGYERVMSHPSSVEKTILGHKNPNSTYTASPASRSS